MFTPKGSQGRSWTGEDRLSLGCSRQLRARFWGMGLADPEVTAESVSASEVKERARYKALVNVRVHCDPHHQVSSPAQHL